MRSSTSYWEGNYLEGNILPLELAEGLFLKHDLPEATALL
jgi:hypothetical protein